MVDQDKETVLSLSEFTNCSNQNPLLVFPTSKFYHEALSMVVASGGYNVRGSKSIGTLPDKGFLVFIWLNTSSSQFFVSSSLKVFI